MSAGPSVVSTRPRRRVRWSSVLAGTLLIVGLIATLFPFVWLVSTAFKKPIDAFALPPTLIFEPTLANFERLLDGPFLGSLANSFIVTTLATVLSLALGVPAGYAMAQGSFRGRRLLGMWLIIARLAPPVVYIIPMYLGFRALGLLNTHTGLSLAYLTFTLPFVVWTMSGYFADIPSELVDAARIDGCSRWGAFIRVVVPISMPGIVSVAVLTAIFAWGEYFFPLILGGSATMTAPVSIVALVGVQARDWSAMAAAGLLVIAPVFILSLVVQSRVARGMLAGSVKG